MSRSTYTVTFEATYKLELDDAPDDDESSRTRQALQDELGHSGLVVTEVVYVA